MPIKYKVYEQYRRIKTKETLLIYTATTLVCKMELDKAPKAKPK